MTLVNSTFFRRILGGISTLLISASALTFEIEKQANDDREFDFVTLANGLKVMVVHDPAATKAAASLDVFVGSGDDPKQYQGLAHFLEHMLFLGSKDYPDSDAYGEFISSHGGGHNAYTSLLHTNYFFDVDPEFFEEALDRFASMIKSPLLTETYVEREVNAVHSEFTSRFKNEYLRRKDALSGMLVSGHPLGNFSTGNLDSLPVDDPNLLVTMRKFYQDYYRADLMTLVVSGPQSTAELLRWAKSDFDDVKASEVTPTFAEYSNLFDEEFLPARIDVVPEKDIKQLSFVFPIAPTQAYQNQKPTRFIGHLIGHEGEGFTLLGIKK